MNWTIKNIICINGWLLTFLPFALGGRLNETSACLGLTVAASSYLQNTFGKSLSLAWGNYDGRDLKICTSRSATIRGSCCSKQHEKAFLDNAFTITSRYSPRSLSGVIRRQTRKVSDQVLTLLHQTMEKARYRISIDYRVPESKFYPSLATLFRKLSLFISASASPAWTPLSPDVEPTRDYIESFFRDMFPLIVNYHFSGAGSVLSAKLYECLKNKYSTFRPRPFRNLLTNYGRSLNGVLAAYQTLLGALRVSAELVNLTTISALSPTCLNGLIRLRLCHLCAGQNVSRPCAGVCLNVHRGCFAHLLPLRRGWKELVRSTRALVEAITAGKGLIAELKMFDSTIMTAWRQAIYEVPRYGQQIIRQCMHAAIAVDDDNQTTPNSTAAFILPTSTPQDVEISDAELLPRLSVIRSLLTNNQLYFDLLPDQFCKGLRSRECWNGTHQSRTGYSHDVLAFSSVTQPVNPEVQMEAPKSFPITEVENRNNKLLDYSKRLMRLVNSKLTKNPKATSERLPDRGVVVYDEGSGGTFITGLPLPNLPVDDEEANKKGSRTEISGNSGFELVPQNPALAVPSPSRASPTLGGRGAIYRARSPGGKGSNSPPGLVISTATVMLCLATRLLVT